MNVVLFIWWVGQLYAEALSRYSDLDIKLSSVMHKDGQSIIIICFDCNINFESLMWSMILVKKQLILPVSDIEINALWITKSKWMIS